MNSEPTTLLSRRTTLRRFVPLVGALLLFGGITVWGAWSDFVEVRNSVLAAEAFRLRTHAERTVSRIEQFLEEHPEQSLGGLPELEWLRQFWDEVVPEEPQRLYTALVDLNGVIVKHSNPLMEGRRIEHQWYDHTLFAGGLKLVETTSPRLSLGARAYDIQVRIQVDHRHVGNCHAGIDAQWLDGFIGERQGALARKWVILAALIALTVVAASFSMVRLARESAYLKQTIALQQAQRLTELGRLAGGLAHEIRNPLNAIRLNLFTLQRKLQNLEDPPADMTEIFSEVDLEIERLENLIRSVLGYARPTESRRESTDIAGEVDATVRFVQKLMEKEGVTIRKHIPEHRVTAHIDRDRLRQMLLNLLNNARDVSGDGGTIDVAVRPRQGWVDIEVGDSGPGVSEQDKSKIFEPFYTTKESGMGLGLALVKRFAEEAKGSIFCESNGQGGATFRISLPLNA